MPRVVAKAAELFNLGEIKDVGTLDGGVANRNFRLRTNKGEFLIKQRLEHSHAAVQAELEFCRHLIKHSQAIPSLIEDPQGEACHTIDATPVTVQEFVSGYAPSSAVDSFRQIGATLGRLHKVPVGQLNARENWLSQSTLSRTLRELETLEDSRLVPLLKPAQDFLALNLEALPHSIIHGDYHHYNILVNASGKIWILDWEEVNCSTCLLDVATALFWMGTDGCDVDVDLAQALLDGYTVERALYKDEIALLSKTVGYISLAVGLWLAHRYLISAPNDEYLSWLLDEPRFSAQRVAELDWNSLY
ncbi:MAG: phosphotransferase [Pseudomonadota bacterium]